MDDSQIIEKVELERKHLEDSLNEMISDIGDIPIANERIMPYGWRKAAKGRTVWRILEEIISQNIEKNHKDMGFDEALPSDSEVGVYDFKFKYPTGLVSYVNIKSAVDNIRPSKDDISKGDKLYEFYNTNKNSNLYIATFVLSFNENLTISIKKCIVFPVSWIPDVYVNPSNNGNLQSSYYKNLDKAVRRTNLEFISLLRDALELSTMKKKKKIETLRID